MNPWNEDMLITSIGAVVLALVMILVPSGGRMGPVWRGRLELLTALILYPAVSVLWAWRAYDSFTTSQPLFGVLFLVVFGIFAWIGVQSIRRRTLAPFARNAR